MNSSSDIITRNNYNQIQFTHGNESWYGFIFIRVRMSRLTETREKIIHDQLAVLQGYRIRINFNVFYISLFFFIL